MTKGLGLLAVFTLCATPLSAQESGPWPDRVFVTLDVPVQPLSNNFSESLALPDAVRRTENVTFVTDYPSTRGVAFGAGAGVRLVKNLGIGVALSWFRGSSAGAFDLKMPNPIARDSPLDLTGSVPGLNRDEFGVHIQALHALPLGGRARVMISGGPSVFRLKQDLLRSVQFDVLPGFTSLKFDQAIIASVDRTVVGFNVGAGVSWPLRRHLAVGTVTRYARAKAALDPGSQSNLSRTIEVRAGGFQIGGGVQLLF